MADPKISFFGTMALLAAALSRPAQAMALAAMGNTLVLSGPVTGVELGKLKEAFAANPTIDLVVLRNSFGGDANAGYQVGEYLREAGVTTAASGYCISSCSRMFLGGRTRLFTDDYPPERIWVGFHGHYAVNGNLDRDSVKKHGLTDWIIRYSDGKADRELVRRWVAIQKNIGAANFFHPDLAARLGHSVFFCEAAYTVSPSTSEAIGYMGGAQNWVSPLILDMDGDGVAIDLTHAYQETVTREIADVHFLNDNINTWQLGAQSQVAGAQVQQFSERAANDLDWRVMA